MIADGKVRPQPMLGHDLRCESQEAVVPEVCLPLQERCGQPLDHRRKDRTQRWSTVEICNGWRISDDGHMSSSDVALAFEERMEMNYRRRVSKWRCLVAWTKGNLRDPTCPY